MKLDPKYFNLFIAVCAVFTVIVILYGTIRYHNNQEKTTLENINETELGGVYLKKIDSESDSIKISDFYGDPVLIDFWATWSGKSQSTHRTLQSLQVDFPELVVLAAAVRDDEEMARSYMTEQEFNFIYVIGTELYHDLQVPGIPSQILIDAKGQFFDLQIGDDRERLKKRVEALVQYE